MSPELYPFMVFLWKSILIGVAFSPLDFGEASKMLWELISPLVQLSTLSLVVKSKGLTKFLKTCSELVFISFGKNWEKSLPFAEFAYNNSFQSSLNMAPFELLY